MQRKLFNHHINDTEITFVIQGNIRKENNLDYKNTISSIKKYFPQSPIILSTWEGENIDKTLAINEIIFNKDNETLKPIILRKNTRPVTIGKQICTTINGLKKVQTKYAFKIRTDFLLTGNSFLTFFNNMYAYIDKYKFVNQRILACSHVTHNPNLMKFNVDGSRRFFFHLADFCFFGQTIDLINLWDIKYPTHAELLETQFSPEQYLATAFFKKHTTLTFKHRYSFDKKHLKINKMCFLNNFLFLSQKQFNIKPFSTRLNTISIFNENKVYIDSFYHYDWLLDYYRKYIDNKVDIPKKYLLDKKHIEKVEGFKQFKRNISKLLSHIFIFRKWRKPIRMFLYHNQFFNRLLILIYPSKINYE